ncbi:hypothetical protein LG634_09805 [Streptomyces bambusae]|uniref:hypothetical protein n=1 Tax=Streptomyces bambusae TaxID=1550616 RepID=UPI001CFD0823|nr:hypothetical protein [Streptomyces bambusae]MCB5165122.1 hypothetical protein [Streptomyces bambusae]
MELRRTAGVAALLASVTLTAAGCGGTGRLESAGPTPVASGPVHLWPERRGATVAPADPAGSPPEYVTGIPRVVRQNVRQVDPLAVVRAEQRATAGTTTGPDWLPDEVVARIGRCKAAGEPGCPVLKPYYRDLTGNGREELVLGIELPDRQLAVRAYTADPDGRLNRIMGTIESVIAVELAGRDIILRVPGGNPGYEWNIAWSWDPKQRSMLITRDQILRIPQAGPRAGGGGTPLYGTPGPSRAAAPAPSPSPAGSR